MLDVFFRMLSLSASASLLILALLLLRPLYTRLLSKRWRYYIWLLVLLRLILPFALPGANLMDRLFHPALAPSAPGQTLALSRPGSAPLAPDPQRLLQAEDPSVYTSPAQDASEDPPAQAQALPPQALSPPWQELLSNSWVLWLGVALMLLVRKVTVYHSFTRFIQAGWQPVLDPQTLGIMEEVSAELGLRTPLPMYHNPLAASPMLVGIRQPVVILPTLDLPMSSMRYVLLHEALHAKRKDILYQWLGQLVLCLHWFNPLVYPMRKEIGKACELSCDEGVLARLSRDQHKAYGNTLLAVLAQRGSYYDAAASMTMSEEGLLMKERLQAMISRRSRSKASAWCAAVLTVLLLCGSVLLGAYTGQAEEAAPMAQEQPTETGPAPTAATAPPAPRPTQAPDARASAGDWGAALGQRIGDAVEQGVAAWLDGFLGGTSPQEGGSPSAGDWGAALGEKIGRMIDQRVDGWLSAWDFDWDWDWDDAERFIGSYSQNGRTVTSNLYYRDGYLIHLRYDSRYEIGEEDTVLPGGDVAVPPSLQAAAAAPRAQAAIAQAVVEMQGYQRIPEGSMLLLRSLEGPFTELPDELIQRYYQQEDIAAYVALLPYASQTKREELFEAACAQGQISFVAVTMDTLGDDYDVDSLLRKAHADGDAALFYVLLYRASDEALAAYEADLLSGLE